MWLKSEFRIEGYSCALDVDINAHLAAVSYARRSNEEMRYEMPVWDINKNSHLMTINCHRGVFCQSLNVNEETLIVGKVDRPLLKVRQLHGKLQGQGDKGTHLELLLCGFC